VLKRVEDPRSHWAARYDVLPAALDALVDPVRLEAFEAHPPRGAHPYHRWRQWRASQMAQAEIGERDLPQDPDDESLGINSFPQAEAVGVSSFPQLGQASSPELPVVDPREKKELTTTPATADQSSGEANDNSAGASPRLATGRPPLEWAMQNRYYGMHRVCGALHQPGTPCYLLPAPAPPSGNSCRSCSGWRRFRGGDAPRRRVLESQVNPLPLGLPLARGDEVGAKGACDGVLLLQGLPQEPGGDLCS
jgi:hypothetical protein